MSLTDLKVLLFALTIVSGLTIYLLTRIEIEHRLPFWDYAMMILVYLILLNIFNVAGVYYWISGKKPKW